MSPFDVSIATYDASLHLRRHRHDPLVVVCLLAGSARETVGARELTATSLTWGLKAPGQWHADTFGDQGVCALRIGLAADGVDSLPEAAQKLTWRWQPLGGALATVGRLSAACLRGTASDALVWDTLSVLLMPTPARRAAPEWLRTIREEIDDDPATARRLEQLAARAGVHPMTLCRAFRHCYGTSVVEYRRRRLVEVAWQQVAAGRMAIGCIAINSGFYDHAAMTRAFRRFAGIAPSELRRATEQLRASIRQDGIDSVR